MTKTPIDPRDVAVWGLGAFLLIVLSALSVNANVPEPWAPFPVLVTFGFLMNPAACLVVGPGILLIGTYRLLRGDPQIGTAATAVCATIAAYDAFFILVCTPWGIEHQGVRQVLVVGIANGLLLILLAILWRRARIAPSFGRTFAFYWTFAAWLCTYRLPWLGEMFVTVRRTALRPDDEMGSLVA